MEKHTYRNAIRSKRLIKGAFLHLISKKEISRVRIKELTELADISKGTFYAHYQDIYAVLEEIEDENIQSIIRFLEESPTLFSLDDFRPFLIKLFSNMEDNKESYTLLFKSQSSYSFLAKLQNVFVESMMRDKVTLSKLRNESEANIFFKFVAIGTSALVHNRYTNSSEIPIEDLIESLNTCILYGVNGIKIV